MCIASIKQLVMCFLGIAFRTLRDSIVLLTGLANPEIKIPLVVSKVKSIASSIASGTGVNISHVSEVKDCCLLRFGVRADVCH